MYLEKYGKIGRGVLKRYEENFLVKGGLREQD
jgi:hypothetical protein